MIRQLFIPAMSGDYRLEADPDAPERSVLTIENATPHEADVLAKFLQTAARKTWIDTVPTLALEGLQTVLVRAPVAEAGAELVVATGGMRPGTLLAVRSTSGTLTVTETLAEVAPALAAPEAVAAVQVPRPTPCCPSPELAAEVRASDVLKAFCTPAQWADWTLRGFVTCLGGYTGHRYRIVHRNNALAVKQGRICADLDDLAVLHFHNSLLPPPEEVLSALLILQHREDWLRNGSTCLSSRFTDVFVNPLGHPTLDGVSDADLVRKIGTFATGFAIPFSAAGPSIGVA